jgi:hypothetical protein
MSQLRNQLAFFFAETENKPYFALSKQLRTMKGKRIAANIAIVFIIAAGIILTGSCKKQHKCGCDGDALDTLR